MLVLLEEASGKESFGVVAFRWPVAIGKRQLPVDTVHDSECGVSTHRWTVSTIDRPARRSDECAVLNKSTPLFPTLLSAGDVKMDIRIIRIRTR